MKNKSTILLITLIFFESLTLAMEPNQPAEPAPKQTVAVTTQPAKPKSTYFGSFIPGLEPFEKLSDAAEKFGQQADKISNGLEEAGKGINKVGESFGKVGDTVISVSNNFKETIENASDKFEKATNKVSNELDRGMKVAPETIVEFNKLLKTCFIGSIGGAVALSGIILFFKTLMSQNSTETPKDTRPLYQRILTNRYLISALLMAAGTGIILKSDKIVAAIS